MKHQESKVPVTTAPQTRKTDGFHVASRPHSFGRITDTLEGDTNSSRSPKKTRM